MIVIDLLKRAVQRFQPYPPIDGEPSKELRVDETIFELETDSNRASSFWLDKQVTVYDLKLNDVLIPAAIIKVSFQKNVVKTVLAGLGAVVNEIIGATQYTIEVGGLVIDENGKPEEQIEILNRLFAAREALEVECEFLRIFDIHYIVIEAGEFPPVEGVENVIPFSFSACDDQPIELELKNGVLSKL